MMKPVSIAEAIRRGRLVNGLILPLMIGIPLLSYMLALPPEVIVFSVPLAITLAWLHWSYQVPKWRLWAIQNVEDLYELHKAAVMNNIEWPHGSFFERTEIKSYAHQRKEVQIQLAYYLLTTLHKLPEDQLDQGLRHRLEQIHVQLQDSQIATALVDETLAQLEALITTYRQKGITPFSGHTESMMFSTLHFLKRYRWLLNYGPR